MKDMLKNDVKVGDRILVYDVNHMILTTVTEILDESIILVQGDADLTYKSYNVHKCVVINEQLKYNIDTFPERFI